ncbi:MAG: carboxypeptidase regulatory-like domain-containing protein [bacterium]
MRSKNPLALFIVLSILLLFNGLHGRQPSENSKLAAARKLQLARTIETARHLVQSQRGRDVRAAAPSKPSMRFNVNGNQAIAGTVKSSDDSDLKGVMVIAFTADSSQTPSRSLAYVNADGSYLIEHLLPGSFYVVAEGPDFFPQYYDHTEAFDQATLVTVAESDTTTGIDFTLRRILPGTGAISGRVVHASDNLPIANATINVYSRENPFYYGSGVTASDGTYHIAQLKSGSYFVQVWADGYLNEFFDNARAFEQATLVTVLEPQETTNINFNLSIGGTITGRVTNVDGKPFMGAIVEAHFAKLDSLYYRGYGVAISDGDGSYKISGLETGAYVVSAQAWNQWGHALEWYENVSTPDSATAVQVSAGQATVGIDFSLYLPQAAGSIAGLVTNMQGEPLAGVMVNAMSWPGTDPLKRYYWASAYTDADGRYRFELPTENYLVSATAYSAWQSVMRWYPNAATPDSAQPVHIAEGVHRTDIDFKLPFVPGNSVIYGRVLGDDGRPLAYAFIEITPADNGTDPAWRVWAYGSTDSTGAYMVPNLPPGSYLAHAQYWENLSFGEQWYDKAGSREQARPIKLEANQRIGDIDFSLALRPIYGTIIGKVTSDADGSPMARAYVEVSPLKRDGFNDAPIAFWGWNAITDENGEYRLDLLPEGEYLVVVYADGAFEYFENAGAPEQATPVKVVGGDSVNVNVALTRRREGTGVISGFVGAEYTDQLLPIAVVIARPVTNTEKSFVTVATPEGGYKMTGIAPGDYMVMSFAPYYIGEYYDNTFDPSLATPVKVDGQNPAGGINFTLLPMYFLRGEDGLDPRAGTGATVLGKVSDTAGKEVVEAYVYVLNANGQPLSFSRTSVEGKYEITGIPPGPYRMLASHVAHSSKYNGNAVNFEEAVPVDLGFGKIEVNFVLEAKPPTGVKDRPDANVPRTVELYGNAPNPFNPETRIRFGLPAAMPVRVRIFNMLGEEVTMLQDGIMSAGVHHLTWNGRDQTGRLVGSGVYLYRLESGGVLLHRKMVLLR